MRTLYNHLTAVPFLLACIATNGQTCLSNFEFSGCSNNFTFSGGLCPTFTNTNDCSGWTRSHGTPEILSGGYAIELIYVNSKNEGIFTSYPFIQGNNYDVMTSYDFHGNAPTQATGTVNILAASGVTYGTLANCQDPIPTGPSSEAMYTRSTSNSDLSVTDDIQTVTQLSAAFDQVWVYPTGSTTQNDLDLYAVYVCPSCYAVTTYSSGTLPVQINGQDITISIPAQDVNTLVEVTDAVYLQKGFQASPTGSVSFIAEINSNCTYSNEKALSMGRNRDSANAARPAFPGTNPANPAAAGLRIYPTVSKGMVTLTGPAASMADVEITVLNSAGQIVYQRYNGRATALQIDLGNAPDGLYIIRIRQNSKVTAQKIIISK